MNKRNWKVSSQENLPDWVNELGKKHPSKLTDDELKSLVDFNNSDEYRAKSVNELTFEDWLSGDFPKQLQHLNEPFKQKGLDIDGQRFDFSVSELEFSKIEAHKQKVFEEIYTGYFDRLCSAFVTRLAKSRNKDYRLRSELENLNKLLSGGEPKRGLTFPDGKGGATVYSPFFDLPGSVNMVAELLEERQPLYRLINPNDDENALPLCVMVGVMMGYQLFLKQLDNKSLENLDSTIPEQAMKWLKILGGKNIRGRKIMADSDYQRLVGYVSQMIKNEKLPDNIQPVEDVELKNENLRYLFWNIHNELYSNRPKRIYFINFLHKVFPQFKGDEAVTFKKFGDKPVYWDDDLQKINGG